MFVWDRVSTAATTAATPDGIVPGGDRENAYAWCMDVVSAEDGDWLYVGGSRGILYLFLQFAFISDAEIQSVFRGDIPATTDTRARIFRWKLDGSRPWEEVYRSPMLSSPSEAWARDVGYRGCVAFGSGPSAGLLAVSVSPFGQVGSRVLRIRANASPGEEADEILRIAPVGDQTTNTLRPILAFDDLVAVGTQSNDLYVSADPPAQPPGDGASAEGWERVATDADFGGAFARDRQSLWQFARFNGWIYAVLGNVEPDPAKAPVGFRMYKGRPAAGDPAANAAGWVWVPLVGEDGAFPPGLGVATFRAASLTVYRDRMYVGTFNDLLGPLFQGGVSAILGSLRPAQIYRFDAQDRWQLVIGDPDAVFPVRVGSHRAGFFEPTSSQALLPAPYDTANFSMNQYVWWMESWQGRLFAATFDMRVFVQYASDDALRILGVDDAAQRAETIGLISKLSAVNANPPGFDLWVTDDGVSWWPITTDGFGSAFNYGGRTLKGTSAGLFAGTANPFYGAQVWRIVIEGE
jgi:hypothetical protein